MKAVHLKKIAGRIDRLTLHFGDEARVWRMLVRTVPNILPREASNRANDLTRVLHDAPELIETIRALREERATLRRTIHALELEKANDDQVLVSRDALDLLRMRDARLTALENAGVDNWEGMDNIGPVDDRV